MLTKYSKKEFKEFLGSLFFFLLWPFGSVIHSLKNNKKVWAKNTFWFFCIFYGFNFVIINQGVDAYKYAEVFISWSRLSWSMSDFTNALYSGDTKTVDIFQPLLSFTMSRFTDDPRMLFAVFGFVFGFFYSRNLWYLLERINTRKSLILFFFLAVFCLIMPIWKINAFRFAVAIHIYLYGIFPFLVQGKKRKLWISVFSVFVHFTFLAPVLILIIYVVFGNRYKIYFALFLISLLINELNLNFIKYQFQFLPDVFQEKSNIYLTDNVMVKQSEGIIATNWYIRYYFTFLNWIAYVFIISLYLKARNKIIENKIALNLFSFAILFYAFANISNLMPQGIRFFNVSSLIFFFMIIYMVSVIELPLIFRKLMLLSVPFLIVIIVVALRMGMDFTSLVTIIGNPIIALAVDYNVPLIELFK